MSRRAIKKKILAEAMRLYREHEFEATSFQMTAPVWGTHYQHRPTDRVSYRDWWMNDLLHQCKLLEAAR